MSVARVRPEGYATDDERAVRTRANYVTPGFFGAAGMELIAGRDFRDDETFTTRATGGVVILSQLAAQHAFPNGDAVGRRVDVGVREPRILEVVGVVADARIDDPHEEPGPAAFEPFGQSFVPGAATIYVRSRTNIVPVTALQRAAPEIDAALPFFDMRPLTGRIDERLVRERVLARITTLFAGLALLLAAVGVYGVMTCAVGERVREFGIRLALGASPGGVRHLVLRQGLVHVGAGLLVGLLAALWAGRLIANQLHGVRAWEPRILAGASLTLLAALVPAWRATRVDPVRTLRSD